MEISHANELNLLQQKIFQKAIRFSLRLTQKAIFVTKEFIPSLYMSLHIALDLKKDEPISAKFNRRGRKSKEKFIFFCGDTHPSQPQDMCRWFCWAWEGEFHKPLELLSVSSTMIHIWINNWKAQQASFSPGNPHFPNISCHLLPLRLSPSQGEIQRTWTTLTRSHGNHLQRYWGTGGSL